MESNTTVDRQSAEDPHGFVKGLGLLDSTTLVIGSMIGSGIFIVSASIAAEVRSPGMLLMAWLVTGIITILAALSYGELAAAMPHAGGQYVYLREAFGPLSAFLYGWTLFLVIQTGTIAAVAVAFSKFLNVFVPAISLDSRWYPLQTLGWPEFGISTGQGLAILLIVLLSVMNCFGIRLGALVQNVFTTGKVLGLLGLILIAFTYRQGTLRHLQPFAPTGLPQDLDWKSLGFLSIFGGAMVGSLFSADAWNNVTFTAGEIKNPQRNLPLSLVIGTSTVIGLYLLANLAYLYVMPIQDISRIAEIGKVAKTVTVGTEIVKRVAGSAGAGVLTLAILVSVFGCLNGLLLAGARVYYAMARDGLFMQRIGELHPRYRTPVVALLAQALWASLLVVSGKYSDLLDYVMFAVMIFYVLTVLGLFVLRKTQPLMERPYKVVGYPFLPALYLVLTTLITIDLLYLPSKRAYTWPGLIIVLAGVPVYYLWKLRMKGDRTL
ncbi:MAG: amino acid permease [Acidobacteria bacterium]|nr:amino acid permease [Acidobacteriota bacterium]MBI3657987.1 amino acid permease [Acidobacteriota bacterium]